MNSCLQECLTHLVFAFFTPLRNTNVNSIEPVNDPALLPRVFINDLVKRYGKKDTKPAVNRLNLTLYESQITALLGHNGAGKTSTVSLLTGLFPPTSGDVSIYGSSVVDELAKARQSIGICPQQNVLFDRLTVMEHMHFFSKVKGVSLTQSELEQKALELGLAEEHFRTTAGALSGGNKRKLSVAIALCGDPEFLILGRWPSAVHSVQYCALVSADRFVCPHKTSLRVPWILRLAGTLGRCFERSELVA